MLDQQLFFELYANAKEFCFEGEDFKEEIDSVLEERERRFEAI